MYYKICPYCQAHLDPGERCDCRGEEKEAAPLYRERPQANIPTASLSARPMEVKEGGRLSGYC